MPICRPHPAEQPKRRQASEERALKLKQFVAEQQDALVTWQVEDLIRCPK